MQGSRHPSCPLPHDLRSRPTPAEASPVAIPLRQADLHKSRASRKELLQRQSILAIAEKNLVEPAQPAVAKAAQQQVLVFGISKFGIVGIVPKPARPSAPGRVRKRKADKGPRDNVLMVEAHRHFADQFAAAGENHGAAAEQIELRVLTQASNLPGQTIRKADIIGIHPGDELAPAESDRLVEARRQSGRTGFADSRMRPS